MFLSPVTCVVVVVTWFLSVEQNKGKWEMLVDSKISLTGSIKICHHKVNTGLTMLTTDSRETGI